MWQRSQSHLCGEGRGGRREVTGSGRWRWTKRKVRAEAQDDSVSVVTRVLCQRAAAGMRKCAICDRVLCHAIITCTAATDDENIHSA